MIPHSPPITYPQHARVGRVGRPRSTSSLTTSTLRSHQSAASVSTLLSRSSGCLIMTSAPELQENHGKSSLGGDDICCREGGHLVASSTLRTNSKGRVFHEHTLEIYLTRFCRPMSNDVPSTPRSRRRHASRLHRELEDEERPRRIPVSGFIGACVHTLMNELRVPVSSPHAKPLKQPETNVAHQVLHSRANQHHQTASKVNVGDVRGNGRSVNNSNNGLW